METDNVSDIPLDAMLENYTFYIFRMYEFSHSQDPKRTLGLFNVETVFLIYIIAVRSRSAKFYIFGK